MKRSDCQMITDIALIPLAGTGIVLYVIIGGTFLITHSILATPILYATTGKVVSSPKVMKNFYFPKKKIVPAK